MTIQSYHGNGFTVESVGMHSLRYTEKGRSAIINGEVLIDDSFEVNGYILYADTAGWEDDPADKAPDSDDKMRIVDGIVEALKAWGVSVEVA